MRQLCIVTGAAEGTGLAVAQRFARAGWAVCITSRSAEKAQTAAAQIAKEYRVPAYGVGVNPARREDVQALYQAVDARAVPLGAIVLAAADLGMNQPALDTALADWERVIQTNVIWNYLLAREAARRMQNTGGAIVIVGSNTAVRAIPNRSAYIASKGALSALSRALAVELGPMQVRSNVIVCGNIQNERFFALDKTAQKARRSRAPLGDFAAYEDVAELCFFLGTDASRVITGTEIALDGGVLAQLTPSRQ